MQYIIGKYNRNADGMEDKILALYACGMPQAIEAVYPKSRLQRCIVHQIRSSTKCVSYKDIKQVVADL